jgi:hypothetical protein
MFNKAFILSALSLFAALSIFADEAQSVYPEEQREFFAECGCKKDKANGELRQSPESGALGCSCKHKKGTFIACGSCGRLSCSRCRGTSQDRIVLSQEFPSEEAEMIDEIEFLLFLIACEECGCGCEEEAGQETSIA